MIGRRGLSNIRDIVSGNNTGIYGVSNGGFGGILLFESGHFMLASFCGRFLVDI